MMLMEAKAGKPAKGDFAPDLELPKCGAFSGGRILLYCSIEFRARRSIVRVDLNYSK